MKLLFDPQQPILEICGLQANYGAVTALRNINLTIHRGEIHAIIGEHGAGKSTLAKIVSNLIPPLKGQVLYNSEPLSRLSYRKTIESGIRMVYQKMRLNDSLSVAENIFMANHKIFRSSFGRYSHKKVYSLAGKFLRENNFDLDPHAIVSQLELSDRALLSIVRNLYTPPSILILDESLEKLSHNGLNQVLNSLKKLRDSGSSVLFITHRIDDLYMVADRVSVIRKGEVLITEDIFELDKINLIKMAYTQFSNLEKRTEQAQEFNKLLKYNEAVLTKLPINLIVSSHDNSIQLINDSARSFFKLGERVNFSLEILFFNNPHVLDLINQALNDRTTMNLYNSPLIFESRSYTVNIIVYPILDNAILIGTMLIIEDITERELLREQLVLSEKLASIGLLAAGVAHEINNPLAVISNYLESFRGDTLNRVNKEKIIDHLFNQIEYMSQVIGNLIAFSENQNQKVETIEICKEIQNIIELIKFNGKDKNIRIHFHSDKEEIYSPINRGEFKQVLLNLFKNSFEVLKAGGDIHISAGVLRFPDDSRLRLLFSDNGPGIDFDDPNDVFLPFKTSKHNSHNFGLGLSLCYNILNRYNGDIHVNSSSEAGTVFEISLPEIPV
jgi:ABC-type branched-subunit amino acid transport system ATPase component/nitrogen-specific signal transduction histidine kinase